MKSKKLSSANTHLRSAKSAQLLAQNVASSTSIETGKPSKHYVSRYNASHSVNITDKNPLKLSRKLVS